MLELVRLPEAELILVAVSGTAGLLPVLEAIAGGKTVALANKETLVAGGHLVMSAARNRGVAIIPVDSEHSAIHQCLMGSGVGRGSENRRDRRSRSRKGPHLPSTSHIPYEGGSRASLREENGAPAPDAGVAKLIITGSGGPFRGMTREQLGNVTPQAALRHPTWSMGKKITVDSATLMNKGLEAIEARWLFGVDYQDIEVLIHPQSIVHGLVQFRDGVVMAQLGWPDMRVPIQYALFFPEHVSNRLAPLDLAQVGRLTFERPDTEAFPCLRLALEAGKTGGTMPAVMNAANEVAVISFLEGRAAFLAIPEIVEAVMSRHVVQAKPDLEEILAADKWARQTAHDVIRDVRGGK
jgi:1-deoxy-D-xylulose-5-phosphate reductoisomerase